MRKWQKRSRVSNATERNLAMALAELDRMASRLDLPKSIRESAAVNYKKAVEASSSADVLSKESLQPASTPRAGNATILEPLTKLGRPAELVARRLVGPTASWFANSR